MTCLHDLFDISRWRTKKKRVGRGPGSGLGKTCGRGEKGMGSRTGYKSRLGYEGGQFRTFMKHPIRGFSNAPFRVAYQAINLGQIDECYEEGEVVSLDTLYEKGLISKKNQKVKVLGRGELTKKLTFEIKNFSDSVRKLLLEKNMI